MKRNYRISFVYYGHSSLRMYSGFVKSLSSICRSVDVFDLNEDPFNTNDFSHLISFDNYSRVARLIKLKFVYE